MKPIAGVWWAGMLALGLTVPAQAALQGRLPATLGGTDYQAYYDTVLEITWLVQTTLAASNTFGVAGINANGTMTWATAQSWLAAMNNDGGTGYLGYNDWRLPTALNQDGSGPCNLDQCTDSEMGYMYFTNLGNIGLPDPNPGLTNIGPFADLQSSVYWSGTQSASNANNAWDFVFSSGVQDQRNKANPFHAWAVRPGDVVPEPASIGLVGTVLGGLLGWARRRRRR